MKDPNISHSSCSYEDAKKSDSPTPDTPQQAGILWRLGSGLYSTTTGAVGAGLNLGYGAVKVVANTSYGVVSKTAEVGISATKAVASGSYNAVSGGVSTVAAKLPTPSFNRGKDKED